LIRRELVSDATNGLDHIRGATQLTSQRDDMDIDVSVGYRYILTKRLTNEL
jgi:hypothetical protein